MKINTLLALFLVILLISQPVFADFKISQKTTADNFSTELTIYAKGVRERREQKTIIGDEDADAAAMMAQYMPNFTTISQCDLKQDLTLNDRNKSYFIDYYDWSSLPPDQLKRRPNQKVVIKGTVTVSSVVTDSGKRQQMFGLTARWLKSVMTFEASADSCEGKSDLRIEQEGWFVDLTLSRDTCRVPRVPGGESGGCRPKMIVKSMQDPGFFLEGTTRMFQNNKLESTSSLQTTALSKSPLDQALFEIPQNYTEVDSFSELMQGNQMRDTTAITQVSGSAKGSNLKTVAIDFFSGNTSKVDQNELRGYISSKLSAAGFSGFPINSQADLLTGNFVNVIGVELKKVKESGASKAGGLFGKVTGNTEAAKIGETEAEIVITIYGKDGKTVVASAPANQKVKGSGNDAVKAAIDQILGGLLQKIK